MLEETRTLEIRIVIFFLTTKPYYSVGEISKAAPSKKIVYASESPQG